MKALTARWRPPLIKARNRIRSFPKFIWFLPVAAVLCWVLWRLPQRQVNSYRARIDINGLEPNDRFKFEEDLITAENNARATLAQIIGGTVLLFGLYLTWKNIEVAQEGKLTDRFSKAIELLGNDNLDVRLGGIYALERIARDSQTDHWTVMEVLTAFVREHSPASPIIFTPQSQVTKEQPQNGEHPSVESNPAERFPADIQTVLTVIGRRKAEQDKGKTLQLYATSLHGADLSYANLMDANLTNATALISVQIQMSHIDDTTKLPPRLATRWQSEQPTDSPTKDIWDSQ